MLLIESSLGLLSKTSYLPSPHCDDRPQHTTIDLLVIHGISLPPGEFGGDEVEQLFTNQLNPEQHPALQEVAHLRVSAHVFIRRTGKIMQFVPFNKRAWHAGESSYQGRQSCNDFSIGIELEGADTVPYEPIQYQQLAEVTRAIMAAYPAITKDRIVGHSDIAPGRKTDPGPAFDWGYFLEFIQV
jgi:AmpD protein